MPWLLRLEAWDPAIPGIRTLWFSDVGLVTGPADTPAHTYAQRRLSVPPGITRAVYTGDALGGPAEASFGTAELENADGGLDALADYTWEGHAVELRYAAAERPVLADFTTVLLAVTRSIAVGNTVQIQLADRQDLAERPYAPATFAGTGGAEGNADLAGITKPRALGFPILVEPVAIAGALNVFCYGDGRAAGRVEAYDRGALLLQGLDYPDHAAMMAAGFGTAGFVTCHALSLLRTKEPPSGRLVLTLAGRSIGSQLVTNGDFASGGTGWSTTGATWSYTGNRANKTAGGAGSISRNIATEAGAWYVLGVSRSAGAGNVQPFVGAAALGDILLDERRGFAFQASGTTTLIGCNVDAAFGGWIDDIQVWQVAARAADMLALILDEDGPFSSADFNAGDLATLNTANAAALQHWHAAGDSRRVPEVLDEVAESVGAFWGFDPATGLLRVARWEAPALTAAGTITERQVVSIRPLPTERRLRQITLRAARRWRPLDEGEIPGVPLADRPDFTTQSFPALATFAATATEAKAWSDEEADSLLVDLAAAQAEATRRANLFGPARRGFEVEVVPDIPALDIGQTWTLVHSRFGLSAGRNLRVVNLRRDRLTNALSLTLWG